MHNITDYLIEEASAEEEELLGLEPTSDAQDATSSVERDDNLLSVLDRIILYLRIVHSLDYYNHCEYPNEDEMPNRCGILHARGPPPTAKVNGNVYTLVLLNTHSTVMTNIPIFILTTLDFSLVVFVWF